MQMGRGEELGSGVLNVSKYLPLYAKGAKAQFVEGNPFISVIPLPAETGEKTMEKILRLIQDRPGITTEVLSSIIAVSPKGIEWNFKKLKEEGVIRRVGADKGGHWEVVKDQQP
jgi:ATP-dependent DNA helicase RecG